MISLPYVGSFQAPSSPSGGLRSRQGSNRRRCRSLRPWRGCRRRRCWSLRRCKLDFSSLSRKDRANQENLVQSYRICLTLVLFKSVKAGFIPSLSTMTCLTSVSSFLVASVPFTLTEYFPLPMTSLHPLVSSRVMPQPPWGTWRLCKNCLWILVLGGLPPVRLSRCLRRCYKTPC